MKPKGRIDRMLDQALRSFGTPPDEVLEAARERVRRNLKMADVSAHAHPPALDARPAGLWGLRLPFLIAGSAAIVLALLTAAMVRSPSWRAGSPVIPQVAPQVAPQVTNEPLRLAPPVTRNTGIPEQNQAVEPAKPPVNRTPKPAAKRKPQDAPLPKEPSLAEIRPVPPVETPTPEPAPAQAEGDPDRAVLERVCTACHSLRGIEKHAYADPEAYRDLISDMISRGAVISEEEMAVIIDYLYRTYGQK
jgi:hypothetical protein